MRAVRMASATGMRVFVATASRCCCRVAVVVRYSSVGMSVTERKHAEQVDTKTHERDDLLAESEVEHLWNRADCPSTANCLTRSFSLLISGGSKSLETASMNTNKAMTTRKRPLMKPDKISRRP